MPIDAETLKTERDQLKEKLRELESEQRKLETELKGLRQQEIRTKREIEALTTLLELHDGGKDAKAEERGRGKKPDEASAG